MSIFDRRTDVTPILMVIHTISLNSVGVVTVHDTIWAEFIIMPSHKHH